MRYLILLAALSLGACVAMPDRPTEGVQALGPNTWAVSQRATPFGSPVQRAAAFCGQFGQRIQIEGNTTEQTVWTDQVYSVLVFSCQDVA